MTDRNCAAELCPYWPGEGCLSGVMPCDKAAEDRDKEKAWMAAEIRTWFDPQPGDITLF